MSTLLLRFRINLEERNGSTYSAHKGPLFHRWLPDGEKDAIILNTGYPKAELKVWFERFGCIRKGDSFITHDYERREVDPDTMVKQGVLEGGPLFGLLKIQALSEEELTALRENKVGDAHYVDLGEKVVKLIHTPLARFLNILRTNYGQYWIRALEGWNPRTESLGSYCSLKSKLNLEWSLDEEETWTTFKPNEPIIHLTATMIMDRSFREYITKEDWQEIAKVNKERYEPSLAASLLARAHKFMNQGNLKHSFVEGVSALEVALEEFVRQKLDNDDSLAESIQAFWGLPRRTQMISIVSTLGTTQADDMKLAVKAIAMRDKVVHKGWDPPKSAERELSGLLKTVATLLPGPRFRFPSGNPGNTMKPEEEWEKLK